jgi:hypothetical protein
MYHLIHAFDKPAFGTAGSEARTIRKRCFVKYSLILLSALLVVACGGLTKAQQGNAYNDAAIAYDEAREEAFTTYETAWDASTTDDEGLVALTVLYARYADATSTYRETIEAIKWTPEFIETAQSMITCMREVTLLQLEVLTATDTQGALDLSDTADAKSNVCGSINESFRTVLGLGPVSD